MIPQMAPRMDQKILGADLRVAPRVVAVSRAERGWMERMTLFGEEQSSGRRG